MTVLEMWRFTTCAAIAVVMLATGAARAQVAGEVAQERGGRGQEAPDGQESSGPGAMMSGLARIFTAERLHIHLNGAYQVSSSSFEAETSFRAYGEQARLLTREEFQGAGHVDVGGSLRVWRGLAFGAGFTQMKNAGSGEVTGTIPHPLEAGQDRTLPPQTPSLTRRERATHAYLAWRISLRPSIELELSAGASYFSLRQGVVADLSPIEVGGPPFAEVGLQVGLAEHTRSGAGFNAGIDLTYMLTPATRLPQVGIGCFVRVTDGAVSLPTGPDTRRSVSVGGVQTGAGLRLRF